MGSAGLEPATRGFMSSSGASLPFGRSRDFPLGDWDHTCHRAGGDWCGFGPCVLPSLLPTSVGSSEVGKPVARTCWCGCSALPGRSSVVQGGSIASAGYPRTPKPTHRPRMSLRRKPSMRGLRQAVFLDVREPVEWEQHIAGAVQVPMGLLEFAADRRARATSLELDPGSPGDRVLQVRLPCRARCPDSEDHRLRERCQPRGWHQRLEGSGPANGTSTTPTPESSWRLGVLSRPASSVPMAGTNRRPDPRCDQGSAQIGLRAERLLRSRGAWTAC